LIIGKENLFLYNLDGDELVSTGWNVLEGACRATLVELVNTTGESIPGNSYEYAMAA